MHIVTPKGEVVDKVVFMGSFGVGKTVALGQLSDIPVVNTDVMSSETHAEFVAQDKTTTTVGFDYGVWRLGKVRNVHLYGLPSQERFNLVWSFLLPDSSAVVLWLYGNKPDGLEECRYWLDVLKAHDSLNRLCVAITRVPHDTDMLPAYRELIAEYHPLVPVITADPRDRDSVVQAVMVALSTPFQTE